MLGPERFGRGLTVRALSSRRSRSSKASHWSTGAPRGLVYLAIETAVGAAISVNIVFTRLELMALSVSRAISSVRGVSPRAVLTRRSAAASLLETSTTWASISSVPNSTIPFRAFSSCICL